MPFSTPVILALLLALSSCSHREEELAIQRRPSLAKSCQEEALRSRAAGISAVAQPPFVISGDERPSVLAARSRAARRVFDACPGLFALPPSKPLRIEVHSDAAGFRRALDREGISAPASVGVYLREEALAVLRTDTVIGTRLLTHEMSHALVAADFSTCPHWLDETLACFLDSARISTGVLVRGPDAIGASGSVPRLDALLSWRGGERECQRTARSLGRLLERRGGVIALYREARATAPIDPNAEKALCRALGVNDLASAAVLLASAH